MSDLERQWLTKNISDIEREKHFLAVIPNNTDSIGIEIVGVANKINGKYFYENVNDKQNESLNWLMKNLTNTLNIPMTEIYRHPEIARKNVIEASTEKW